MDTKPIFECTVSGGESLPSIGDDVELPDADGDGTLYVVMARVWTVEPYAVASYVRSR